MSFIKPGVGDPFFQSSGPHRAFINHSPHLQGSVRHVRVGQQNETHRTKQPQIAQVSRKRKNSDVQLDNEPLDRRKKTTQLADVQASDASSYGQWAQQQNFNKKKKDLVLSTGVMETLVDRYKDKKMRLVDFTPSRMFVKYIELGGLQENFGVNAGIPNQQVLMVTSQKGTPMAASGVVLLISDDKIDDIASYYTNNKPVVNVPAPVVNVAPPAVNVAAPAPLVLPAPVVNMPPYPAFNLPPLPPMPNIYLDGRQVRHVNPFDVPAPMDFANPPPAFFDQRRQARTNDSLDTPVNTYRTNTPNNQGFVNRLNTTSIVRRLRNNNLFRRMSGRPSAASAPPRFNPFEEEFSENTDIPPQRPSLASTVPMNDTAGDRTLDVGDAEDDTDLDLNQDVSRVEGGTQRWYTFKTYSHVDRARLGLKPTLYMRGNKLFTRIPKKDGQRLFFGVVLKENPEPGVRFPVIDVAEDGELFRWGDRGWEAYSVGDVDSGTIVLDYVDDNPLMVGKGFKSRGGAFRGATFLLKDKVSQKYVYEITFKA